MFIININNLVLNKAKKYKINIFYIIKVVNNKYKKTINYSIVKMPQSLDCVVPKLFAMEVIEKR